MNLPIDWKFNKTHTGLEESGAVGTGEETLADFVVTVAITEQGGLPENPSFGAGLMSQIVGGLPDETSVGAQLRGYLLEDDRVEEVSLEGTTRVGALSLPISVTPSDGPYRLSGPLTSALIEEIIADMGLEDGESS